VGNTVAQRSVVAARALRGNIPAATVAIAALNTLRRVHPLESLMHTLP
jgi:hypothetical protein